MQLTKVRIENFKQFESLEVDLRPLDCLVGPNNSGKTTLLQALALFDFCVRHCLSKKNGGYEFKRRTISPEEFYVLPVSNPYDLWTDQKYRVGNLPKVIQISVTFDNTQEVTATVDLNFNRFGIGIETTDSSPEWLSRLANYRIAYLPVFSVFLAQEERRTPAVVKDELARGHVHTVIRNLLLDLKEKDLHGGLVETMQRSFPSLKKMRIDFDEVSDRYISVVYQESEHPKEFDVFSAGSGFQQFLYLFGFVRLQQPSMIMLDEPDVHLHGLLQKAMLRELTSLTQEGKQVLLATHSRDLINNVTPENVISLENGQARRLSVEYDVFDALDRLGAVDPTQLPVVQAYQRVLIVEDRSDQEILSIFCSKCLGQKTWQEAEKRLAVCYAKGNPWKQPIGKLRQQLQQMISLRGNTLKAFSVADWDYYPDRAHLDSHVEVEHVSWHIWERAEIENYLLVPDAIIRLLRGEAPNQSVLDEPAFFREYNSLIDNSFDSANDHLVQAFGEYRRLLKENWDNVTISRKAREYLKSQWETEKCTLADAKEIVLPGLKRWLQEHGLGQFSNKSLAEILLPTDLPEEVHRLARRLADFVGISVS